MNMQSRLANILFYFLVFTCIFFIFSQYRGANNTEKTISLWYVYSGSMEPTIRTNDGYILVKAKEYVINDIITFKPKVLKDKYVTHRITEIAEGRKFITKGDHNQSTDQEFGEPLISKEQIIGKALTIGSKPITIPNLGIISVKFNKIISDLNVFMLISIGIGIYILGFIIDSFMNRHKLSKRKRLRMLDIAPYFDPVFFALCAIIFLNATFFGFTIKSWSPLETAYVVVSTEGLPSPTPGERFTKTMSLENKFLFSYVIILEPEKQTTKAIPSKLLLSPKQNVEYTLSIEAPSKLGYYTEKVMKRTYPDLLPDKWFDIMYSRSKILPLMTIFIPGIILNIGFYIWWLRRWQIGRRKVMEWLIPFKAVLRNLF